MSQHVCTQDYTPTTAIDGQAWAEWRPPSQKHKKHLTTYKHALEALPQNQLVAIISRPCGTDT